MCLSNFNESTSSNSRGTGHCFTEYKSGRGAKLTTCFHLGPRLRNSGAIYKLPHTPSWNAQGNINLRVGRYLNIRYIETHTYIRTYRWLGSKFINLNPSRGIQIGLVVFKSVSWYSNSSRGIQIRLVVFKFVSWCSNLSSWYLNSSGV